jgi:hypothetical protein
VKQPPVDCRKEIYECQLEYRNIFLHTLVDSGEVLRSFFAQSSKNNRRNSVEKIKPSESDHDHTQIRERDSLKTSSFGIAQNELQIGRINDNLARRENRENPPKAIDIFSGESSCVKIEQKVNFSPSKNLTYVIRRVPVKKL